MMRLLMPRRVVPVIVAGLSGIVLSASTALADESDTVVSREDIAKQLGFSRDRGIRPTVGTDAPEAPKVSLSAIQFEFNSDRLTGLARNQVMELAAAMELPSLQGFSFAVLGHTDSAGSNAYNRDLSLRRARSVKRYLVSRHVNAARLVEVGLGEDYPVAGTRGDDALNRRVEVVNLGTDVNSVNNAAFPVPTAPSEFNGQQREGGRALLIGIDRYQNVSPLIGTVNDVHAMKAYLSSHLGFNERNVKTLLDGEATRENILRSIAEWLVDGTEQGDDVFLYYSGHGFQQRDDNADEADQLDETLVPVDVSVDKDGVPQGMIRDDELAVLLRQLQGRRVQLVIDACHAGTSDRLAIRDSGSESWRYVKTPRKLNGAPLRIGSAKTLGAEVPKADGAMESFISTKDPSVQHLDITVWAAVRADQKALVDEEIHSEPGSVFTRRILWGARDGKADADFDGFVTRSELHAYLVDESQAYCGRHPHRCAKGLTPQLQAGSGGLESMAFPPTAGPVLASSSKDILVRRAERLVATNEHGVQISIEPDTALPVGSTVDIVVESDRDGHLVLLDISPSGGMVQIFPNEFSERNGVSSSIRAGQTLRLPGTKDFRFSVEPPLGAGMLLAIVADESVQLAELVSRHKDLVVIERPNAYLVELNEALRVEGRTDWGRATREYEVVAMQ